MMTACIFGVRGVDTKFKNIFKRKILICCKCNERKVVMTHKRLRKLLQAKGVQRNNVEDVIRRYREGYFYTANEAVYNRYCIKELFNIVTKLANKSE